MTKRFRPNEVGCIVDYEDNHLKNYDGLEVVDLLNELNDENEQLRKDLIDHSALIKMLEDSKALDIEDIIWNSRGFESQEQFNEVYKFYLFNAKEKWK